MRPPLSFVEWLAHDHKGLAGTIDIAHGATRAIFIKPDLYPEERFYATTVGWTALQRRLPPTGRRVIFDLPAQECDGKRRPQAFNVRLQDSAHHGGVKGESDALDRKVSTDPH